MRWRALSTTIALVMLLTAPVQADEPSAGEDVSLEAHLEAELPDGLGPLEVTTSLGGYRVRLSHAQLERIVALGELAELVAELGGRELIAQAIWLVRLDLQAMCALGGHDGVELSGSWTGLPAIRPE